MQNACNTVGLLYSSANYLPPVNQKSFAVAPIPYPLEYKRFSNINNQIVWVGVRSSQFLIVGEDTILPNLTNCFIKPHKQDGYNTVGPIPYLSANKRFSNLNNQIAWVSVLANS